MQVFNNVSSVEHQDIEKILDKRLKKLYQKAVDGDQKAYNMASDLARYSILNKHGGVYADVDIGPGNVNLAEIGQDGQKVEENEIPMLGPGLRDKQQLESSSSNMQGNTQQEKMQHAAQEQYANDSFGNQFIATPKQHKLIEEIISRIAKDTDETIDIGKPGKKALF